jgi:hypothetical protein
VADIHLIAAPAALRALPGGDLALEALATVKAPGQALALEHPDLDLGHAQPPGMLGREVKLQSEQDVMRLRSRKGLVERLRRVIPTPIDQNPCAQSRKPMDMMVQGWSTSLFQAAQQWSRMSV